MDFTYKIRYLGFECPLKVYLSVGSALCWEGGVTSLVHLGGGRLGWGDRVSEMTK